MIFAWLTVLTSLALWPLGMGLLYGVPTVLVGALFLREVHLLAGRIRRGENPRPMRVFHWSNTYLTLVFVAVAAHQRVVAVPALQHVVAAAADQVLGLQPAFASTRRATLRDRAKLLARAALDVLVPAQDTATVPDPPDGPAAANLGAGAAP